MEASGSRARARFNLSEETSSMRQLLPSRPGDKMDRAWLLFSLFSGVLVWFAFSGIGRAQGPGAGEARHAGGREGRAGGQRGKSGSRAGRWRGARQERGRAGRGRRGHSRQSREHVAVGDPGVRADRLVFALALDLFHGPGDPPVHGISRQRGGARGPGRQARSRDPRQEVSGCLRRLQGQRQLPGPAGAHRHRQLAQWPGRGQGGHAAGHGRDGDDSRNEDQLPGDHRDPGAR